ncbi:MAG: glutathione transferase GstA [Polyangiaceae bacterium]
MKLYYSPGACSLHPHITLREADVPLELERVNLASHKLSDGSDYYAVNPKGYVPALRLDDGTLLTEGAVIDQYVADLKPEKKLIPRGGMERYHVQEWLNFISSEIHKAFGPLFGKDDVAKEAARTKLGGRFDYVEKSLGSKHYLTGDTFTVADAYLFNMLSWTAFTGIDLAKWPALKAFVERVGQRPAVVAALAAERS